MDFKLKDHLDMAAMYLQDILDQVRELQVKVDQLTALSATAGHGVPRSTEDPCSGLVFRKIYC